MVIHTREMTAAEFEQFALLPSNLHRRLELHQGRMIELVSNSRASRIAARLLSRVDTHASAHQLGWTTGADGGYIIAGNRYIPDAAYMSFQRQPQPPDVAYNPVAPDLVIEVISPTDDRHQLAEKVRHYQDAGVVVWLADPDVPSITVYTPGQPEQTFGLADTLSGGILLPDFALSLRDVFSP